MNERSVGMTWVGVQHDSGILTAPALEFVTFLTRRFRAPLRRLLAQRDDRQARFDAGERPDFDPETRELRREDWRVAPLPPDLLDRRVEITGPPERKMTINALNSGARVYMADFEDSLSPTPENLLEGQHNLRDAVRKTLTYSDAATGKQYALGSSPATLMVRPRGLHLPERHLLVDGEPVPGCLFDFGLFLFHNQRELRKNGTGPYFYLPKLEHYLEARWYAEVFCAAEQELELPRGSIKATVLIETLPAAFYMDEILYELRDYAAGLNLGRWDYIFSFIKTVRQDPNAILPDRAEVTMLKPNMRAYARLLVHTCHRRGALAMGGMTAQIPIKNDTRANAEALERVRADKLREVTDGCDGTWVAHPGLVPLALDVFNPHMPAPNQVAPSEPCPVTARELLAVPQGKRTAAGVLQNLRVGVRYLEAWLRGQGCVPLYNLMEDAATAEISRMQLWQWLHHGADLEAGQKLTRGTFQAFLAEATATVREEVGDSAFEHGRYADATRLLSGLIAEAPPEPFLTLPAYRLLTADTVQR